MSSSQHSILDDAAIQSLKVYTAKEVATILGVSRVQSIYEIPVEELPRVRRIGINVLAYMAGVPPVDVAAAVEAFREKMLADRPQVQPLRPVDGERRRII